MANTLIGPLKRCLQDFQREFFQCLIFASRKKRFLIVKAIVNKLGIAPCLGITGFPAHHSLSPGQWREERNGILGIKTLEVGKGFSTSPCGRGPPLVIAQIKGISKATQESFKV